MRIVWLIQGIDTRLNSCFRELSELGDEQLIVRPVTMSNTAYDDAGFCAYADTLVWEQPPSAERLIGNVSDFAPDVVVMNSWTWPGSYRSVMKNQRPPVLRVLTMDNTWHATPRQWLGRLTHRLYLDSVFDCVMVASDRTEWFAHRLGFAPQHVIRGVNTADTPVFDGGPRSGGELAAHQSFLFAGRLVGDKAIDVLASAYQQYRNSTEDPWQLHVVGIGPLRNLIEGLPGVTMHGFVQPQQLARLMRSVSCFVLPSRYEPYGLVVHEAATSGLPLLVTEVAGAVPGLLQDGCNGWVVAAGDPTLWCEAMLRMSEAGPARLEEMSNLSRDLSRRLSPQSWARNVHDELWRRVASRSSAPSRQMTGSRDRSQAELRIDSPAS